MITPFTVLLLIFLGYFPSSSIPSANAVRDRSLASLLAVRHINFNVFACVRLVNLFFLFCYSLNSLNFLRLLNIVLSVGGDHFLYADIVVNGCHMTVTIHNSVA